MQTAMVHMLQLCTPVIVDVRVSATQKWVWHYHVTSLHLLYMFKLPLSAGRCCDLDSWIVLGGIHTSFPFHSTSYHRHSIKFFVILVIGTSLLEMNK